MALALSGFAAMGYEVLFTRVIALSFGSSAYSFTAMLMSFITGIGVGSALVSRLTVKRPLWLLAISQFTVVAALLVATPMVSRLPYLIALMRIELQEASFGFELYQIGKAPPVLGHLADSNHLFGVQLSAGGSDPGEAPATDRGQGRVDLCLEYGGECAGCGGDQPGALAATGLAGRISLQPGAQP